MQGGDVTHDLVDRIYEAAFVPERWPDVIAGLGSVSGAADGRLLAFDGIRPIGVKTTDLSRDLVESFFFGGDRWKQSERIPYSQANPMNGFVIAHEYYPPELIDRDDLYQDLRRLGSTASSERSSRCQPARWSLSSSRDGHATASSTRVTFASSTCSIHIWRAPA